MLSLKKIKKLCCMWEKTRNGCIQYLAMYYWLFQFAAVVRVVFANLKVSGSSTVWHFVLFVAFSFVHSFFLFLFFFFFNFSYAPNFSYSTITLVNFDNIILHITTNFILIIVTFHYVTNTSHSPNFE